LRVDEAQVRWVDGNIFGLQFTVMHPDERVKLQQVIAGLNADKVR
jgi:hypothetical protein